MFFFGCSKNRNMSQNPLFVAVTETYKSLNNLTVDILKDWIVNAPIYYKSWWIDLYKNAPQHILIETGLVGFIVWLMFFKKTAALPRVFMISAIFNVVVGIVLIHYFGLIGAVWTNFMVKPVQALLMFLECRKVYTFKLNAWKIFYTPVIFILVVLISETLAPAHLKFQVEIGQFIVAVLLVYFAYRKELVPLFSRYFNKTGHGTRDQ